MTEYGDTREDIERRLDRLHAKYGPFPVAEETIENDPGFFEHGRDLASGGWRGDAGAWVEDADGRVLLVRHEADETEWATPGGGHEPGESFDETARREVREETGIDVEIEGVWEARRRTIRHVAGDQRLMMLTVRFEARTDEQAPATSIRDEDIEAARWFCEPPDRVADVLTPRIEEWAADT